MRKKRKQEETRGDEEKNLRKEKERLITVGENERVGRSEVKKGEQRVVRKG